MTTIRCDAGTRAERLARADLNRGVITVSNRRYRLTKQECRLLELLTEYAGKALSRDDILREAWDYQSVGMTRTVDVHVLKLRRLLGKEAIETIHGYGYRLMAEVV